MKGLVIKNTGSWYTVKADNGKIIESKIKGNNMKDGKETARDIFARHAEMLIGVKGLDKKPWIYQLGKASEVNGIFYWLCDKSTQLYGGLSYTCSFGIQ